jgi:hypothetical protein
MTHRDLPTACHGLQSDARFLPIGPAAEAEQENALLRPKRLDERVDFRLRYPRTLTFRSLKHSTKTTSRALSFGAQSCTATCLLLFRHGPQLQAAMPPFFYLDRYHSYVKILSVRVQCPFFFLWE